jgi:hypothetical protein
MIKQNMNAFNVQEFQHQRPHYTPQPQQLPSYDEAPEPDFDMRSISGPIFPVFFTCSSI